MLQNVLDTECLADQRLSVSCNKIKDVNFKNLITLPQLKYLGLFNNEVSQVTDYYYYCCCCCVVVVCIVTTDRLMHHFP